MTWRQSLSIRLAAKGIADPKAVVIMGIGNGVTFPEPKKQKRRFDRSEPGQKKEKT